MTDPHPQLVANVLSQATPAYLIDGHTFTETNLLVPWAFGLFQIGKSFDPKQILDRHSYDVQADAIEKGIVDPFDEVNHAYISVRYSRALRPEYRVQAATQRFLRALAQFPASDRYWEDPINLQINRVDDRDNEVRYQIALRIQDEHRLHFQATIQRLGSKRLISWTPQGKTVPLVNAAHESIKRHYGADQYVLDAHDWRSVRLIYKATAQNSSQPKTSSTREDRETISTPVPFDEHRINAVLEGITPATLADKFRHITSINLRMLWVLGLFDPDEPFDPATVIGQHIYTLLIRAIRAGRLSPDDKRNEDYFLTRLRAFIGTPDESLPVYQEFRHLVFATRGGEDWWQAMLAGYELPAPYGKTGDPVAAGEVMYDIVIASPIGTSLQFVSHVQRPDGPAGRRLIAWIPSDAHTVSEIEHALGLIVRSNSTLAYVQTAGRLLEDKRDIVPGEYYSYNNNTYKFMREIEKVVPNYVWQAGEEFSPQPISEAFGHVSLEELDHPRDGRGYGWELPATLEQPTRLELYPERRVAKLRFLDSTREPSKRDYVIDALRTESTEYGSRVAIASVQDRRASLLRVYPSGEFDEHFRLLPNDASSLPDQAVIWGAEAPTPIIHDSDQKPEEWTVFEATRHLGMSRSAVTRLAQAGHLRGRQIANRKWLLNAEDVLNYQRSNAGRKPQTELPTLKDAAS